MKHVALALALALVAGSVGTAIAQDHGAHGARGDHAGGVEAQPHGEGGGEGHEAAGAGHAEHGDPTKNFNWTGHWAPFGSSSYNNLDEHGGSLESGEEHMSVPFVLVLINFGIILFILGWKVAPIARQMAEKRSDDIKGALDEAGRLRDQAKAKLEEYSAKLKAADTEINRMLQQLRADAEAERARIIAAAEEAAALMKKDADDRIRMEIERANVALQQEVVRAATIAAEQILREKTTPADHQKLVDAFLGNVVAAAAEARGRT